jgi:hypothetical protein
VGCDLKLHSTARRVELWALYQHKPTTSTSAQAKLTFCCAAPLVSPPSSALLLDMLHFRSLQNYEQLGRLPMLPPPLLQLEVQQHTVAALRSRCCQDRHICCATGRCMWTLTAGFY